MEVSLSINFQFNFHFLVEMPVFVFVFFQISETVLERTYLRFPTFLFYCDNNLFVRPADGA